MPHSQQILSAAAAAASPSSSSSSSSSSSEEEKEEEEEEEEEGEKEKNEDKGAGSPVSKRASRASRGPGRGHGVAGGELRNGTGDASLGAPAACASGQSSLNPGVDTMNECSTELI